MHLLMDGSEGGFCYIPMRDGSLVGHHYSQEARAAQSPQRFWHAGKNLDVIDRADVGRRIFD
ncbi:hypothetical protein SBA6_960005 [Candidatus Sulfopaludibacter sp. SbA6]|nr:hypothetical protein SBA6_960005 [Candidatus Sulfopaludibacter sp. SbA6]